MPMKKQYTLANLRDMNREQLDIICESRALELNSTITSEGVISLILEDQFNTKAAAKADKKPEPEPEPKVNTTKEGPATTEPMPSLKAPNGNDRVWFKVMAGSQEHEKNDVFASLNGETMLVKRNHWVQLKSKFLPVFEDAVQTEVYLDDDDEPQIRDVPRFNYLIRTLAEGIPQHERRKR